MAEQAPPEGVQEPIAEATVNPGTTPVLPEKIRVHALAKLLGVTSKQVLAEAAALGTELRSAQSSLQRDIAERIHATMSGAAEPAAQPQTPEPEAPAAETPAAETPAAETPAAETAPVETPAAEEAPESPADAAAPVAEPAEKPAPRKRARKKAAPKAQAAPELETAAEPQAEQAAPAADEPASAGGGLFTHAELGSEQQQPAAAPTVQAPLFLQPEAVAAEPAPRRRRSRRAAAAPEVSEEQQPTGPTEDTTPAAATAEGASPSASARAAETTESAASESSETAESTETGDGETGDQQRRRRRGRRGRGRGRGEQAADGTESDETEDGAAAEAETGAAETPQPAEGGESTASTETGDDESTDDDTSDGSSRRRRRRRRRKGGTDGEAAADDDPPNTVVHEREPRNKARAKDKDKDEVQGISGSTRLEAKRQRRRDGRDAGRRRPPILSESEFLARRESVDRVMVVREKSGANPAASTQVAVLEDGILVEHFVTGSSSPSMVGNVYLGRVQNVLPSMEAAFIDIGRGRNGVLYAGEVNWEAAGLGGRERKIEQALRPGDQVLVQVSKDPVGHKGARLTTQISLAGRFLVYVPGGTSTGISRKLPDTERKRLKEILREIVPADAGVIIRTASEGVSEEELARDVTRLQTQWETIEEQATKAKEGKSGTPQALYEEPDLLVKVVRDLFNEDFSKLVIEGEKAWNTVETYIKTVAPDLLPRVERHDPEPGSPDVFATHRIDEQLVKALDRKVWLPSGGTLVIDRTEAMTVVDVNTGKFTGAGGNLEETVTRNNLEAAEEIVRQMRLRDIGGMIVVDFIDMVLESNRDLVLRRLTEALGRDRTRHQVSEVTSLGLVQMTRKKLGTGLVEAFSTTCEHCHGRGIVVHAEPVEVKSGDDGRGQAKESGGRKKRGRDRAAASTPEQPANGQHAQPAVEESADASVKRAHPVALAMAAHHSDDAESSAEPEAHGGAQPGATDAAGVKTAPKKNESVPAEAENVEPVKSEPVKSEPVKSEPVQSEPGKSETAKSEPEKSESGAEAPAPRARRRSRRVSRAAAAPAGEAPEAGTVFVLPASEPTSEPTSEPAAEAPTETAPAPAAAASAPGTPDTAGDGESDTQPARRPRRRRAAARPAGPPVDA